VPFRSSLAVCAVALAAVGSSAAQTGNPLLSVAVDGPGRGTIVSKPAGISCPGTCSAGFPTGTRVTLTAVPESGSHPFGGPTVDYYLSAWGGACVGNVPTCVVTLDSDRSVTASFAEVLGDPLFEIAGAKVAIVRAKESRRIVVSFRASRAGSGTLRLVRRARTAFRTRVRAKPGRNRLVVALPRKLRAGRYEVEVDVTGLNGAGHIRKVLRIPPA
jgi:hypothetical protein